MGKTAVRKATVTIHPGTLDTEWHGISVGKRFKVVSNGEVAFYFVASKIEPTGLNSAFAWVTGERVNGRGVRIESQITHRHCPEGERMELINFSQIG